MRRRRHETRGRIILPLFITLIVGFGAGWLFRGHAGPAPPAAGTAAGPNLDRAQESRAAAAPSEAVPPPAGSPPIVVPEKPEPEPQRSEEPSIGSDPVGELRRHHLRLPLDGVSAEVMKNGFAQRRDAGDRPHEAADLMAPRMTPIHAVESGRIAKLFTSVAGGTTIYQFDPTERYCYYYAHLEQYAPGLHDGDHVAAGDVIGFVGTSGNAPPNAPHLHFAIFKLADARRWWDGTPLDPYPVFKK